MHLVIIGNGFDLWHDMPTAYNDFYTQQNSYLDTIEHYFPNGLSGRKLWSDFENVLGLFDTDTLINERDFMDLSGDEFPTQQMYGLEDDMSSIGEEMVQDINKNFTDWIESITLNTVEQRISLPKSAKYINFNYTNTLQKVYNIQKQDVCHIHGSIEQGNELIFGHIEEVINASHEEHAYYTEAKNNANRVLVALKKPVDDIISRRLIPMLQQNTEISCVTIIGHSLNKIDLSYFSKVLEQYPLAQWECYSYNQDEANNHSVVLQTLGVPKDRLLVGTYTELVEKYPLET